MEGLKNELQKMLEELELRKKKLSSLDFKQNQYVVLFKPVKGEGDLYGVTKKPLNKISSDIQDVLPVPGLEIIKVMGYTEALLQASKYSTIQVEIPHTSRLLWLCGDMFQSLLGNWKLPYTTSRNYRNSYPMRFALRNKDKLVNAFGIEAHQLLLDSLKDYARNHEDVSVSGSLPGERSYQVFLVPSLKGTGDRFKFAIIKKVYDVYHVAFVEHMKN